MEVGAACRGSRKRSRAIQSRCSCHAANPVNTVDNRSAFAYLPAAAGVLTREDGDSSKHMSETDWEARYESGDMPWEKGEPSPGLVDFLAAHPALPRGSVAVPGCGSGHDVRAWAKAGFSACGFD